MSETRRYEFPNASDMSLLVYDCESEEAAHKISKMCYNESNVNFGDIGSNSATYHFRSTINDSDIIKMIDTWWKTSTQSRPLINLTPTENDTPIIPFLQRLGLQQAKYSSISSIMIRSLKRKMLQIHFTAHFHVVAECCGGPIYFY
ncbi:hypothetical protein KIN20_030074 [Parelaphostrongylus tenuis]|uniref:Uncharacterized protein n=1 Tax=Parelaphostrongylus tenuis TaxID=148309 RepID=A0AAD5R3H3_PARTN|nr:hypothetical protein KIN20_030074 [Parelaphostrongylus tenuis]